jgi:hypothetical protein
MQKDLNGTNVKSLGHEILVILPKLFLSSSRSSFGSKKAYDSVKTKVFGIIDSFLLLFSLALQPRAGLLVT